MSEARLLGAIELIYDAVERPERWPEAAAAIGEVVGGGAAFWAPDEHRSGPGISAGAARNSCGPKFVLSRSDIREADRYAAEFGGLIARFLTLIYMSVLWFPSNAALRETIGLRMVQRYLPPLGSAADLSSKSPISNTVLRNMIATLWEENFMFGAENIRSMHLLAPHLDRALRIQMRLGAADLRSGMLSGALDLLTLGVVFVSSSGRSLWLNRRAQEIVDQPTGLWLSPSGLASHSSSETQSLREAIQVAISGGTQRLLTIRRGSDQRPLIVVAVPLSPVGFSTDGTATACGIVFITDPDLVDNPKIDSVRRAFDLTYREAQMAIAIAHGHGLQSAAASMGVAQTTARTQLQAVFAKTATSHQAELAALVNRTLTPLRAD